jgi:anti-sigma-K factor RskA
MEANSIHELTAGYALDALDADELRTYEQHLAHCERCQAEVAVLSSVAGVLAFAVEPAEPPPALRERILDAARAERPNVVPLRPSRGTWAVRALAVAASVAAIGLLAWNVVLRDRLDHARGTPSAVPLNGAAGSVVVGANGQGTLVVAGLDAAPPGRTYEVWVIRDGRAAPAGLFPGGARTSVVHLTRRVPDGSIVGVTVEPAGGSRQPSQQPFITSDEV